MRWFRFWVEALDDDKVQGLPTPLFKHWVNLLCVASQNGGKIASLNQATFRLRISARKAERVISELMNRGLLEPVDGGWTPHNWAGRQFASDDVTNRVRKHRSDVTTKRPRPLHETAPEQNRTEQNPTPPDDGMLPFDGK